MNKQNKTKRSNTANKARKNNKQNIRRKQFKQSFVVAEAPLAETGIFRNTRPTFRGSKNELCIFNVEPLVSVVAGSSFDVHGLKVNPGNAGLCQWLHKIALCFEEYKFTKLEFIYSPTVPSTKTGAAFTAFAHDVTAADPINLTDALNYEGAVQSAVWKSFSINIKPGAAWRFVLNGDVPVGQDPRAYHCGKLFYGVDDLNLFGEFQEDDLIGRLFLRYEVHFRNESGAYNYTSSLVASSALRPIAANNYFFLEDDVELGPAAISSHEPNVLKAETTTTCYISLRTQGDKREAASTQPDIVAGTGPSFIIKEVYQDGFDNNNLPANIEAYTEQQWAVAVEEGAVASIEDNGTWWDTIKDVGMSVLPIAETIFDALAPVIGFFLKEGKPKVYYHFIKNKEISRKFIARHMKHYDFYLTDPRAINNLLKAYEKMPKQRKLNQTYTELANIASSSSSSNQSNREYTHWGDEPKQRQLSDEQKYSNNNNY
jgi:hypothetical protein